MWRSLVRRAPLGRHTNGPAKFGPIQSLNSQVLYSQSKASSMASTEAPFLDSSFCCFSTWASPRSHFYFASRCFSANPFAENEEFDTEIPSPEANGSSGHNGSGGSRFDFEENPGFSFGESAISEGKNGNYDRRFGTVDSDFDFDENPNHKFSEFDDGNGKIDNLGLNINEFASRDDDDDKGQVVVEGENGFEKTEEFVEKLENVLSLLQSSGTVSSLESSLEDVGLPLNEEVVVGVLETPLIPGENFVGFFKWILKKSEFSVTRKVVQTLVSVISHEERTRDAYALWTLVKEIGEKDIGVLSTDILNELISLFSKLGKGKAAFEVFSKFEDFGCVPDADTYYWTIYALARRSIFDWACTVSEKMLNADKLPDNKKVGKIISYLCKGKKVKDAHAIYLWAKEREKFPPQPAMTDLIYSLCHEVKPEGEHKKSQKDKNRSPSQAEEIISPEEKENVYIALEMLNDLSGEERKCTIQPFSFVIKGLCRIKDFEAAKGLLSKMIETGPPPGYTIFNTLITGISKAGDLGEAIRILKIMEYRGLKPDVYSYYVIVSGYAEGGAMEEACKVLDEAKKRHPKLRPGIFYALIHGYCKLEQFDMAVNLMREMKDSGVQPNAEEYNKLIKSLCLKSLDWRTAEKLLEEMHENGLYLNQKTKTLVRAIKELANEGAETESVTTAG